METYRFGMAWRTIGVLAVMLAIAFPLLMIANDEAIEVPVMAGCLAFLVAGVWCYAYYAAYQVTITADGLTLHRFRRRPVDLRWRDVVSVRETEKGIVFHTADQQTLTIPSAFPGYAAIELAASRNVPPSRTTRGDAAARPPRH